MIGVVMFAYGWDKFVTTGLSATAAGFGRQGVLFPALSASSPGPSSWFGGALLIVGVATAPVGVLMVLEMTGAAVATHQYHAVLA